MTLAPSTEERLRQGFRYLNRFMVLVWRLGLGVWMDRPSRGGQILVVTHTGRKSGLRRRTPVNYAIADGEIYCTAAYGTAADWYRNILADPHVEVWLPQGWWEAVAEDVSDHPERNWLMRQILIGSGFAARLAGFDPLDMSDEELEPLTRTYRLVHLRLDRPRTGPGGPGDLAWLWQVATLTLLLLLINARRRPARR